MTWVKSEVIAGHQVTIGVLVNGGTDPQYDHEVTVTAIGTNHPIDATYNGDECCILTTTVGTHLSAAN